MKSEDEWCAAMCVVTGKVITRLVRENITVVKSFRGANSTYKGIATHICLSLLAKVCVCVCACACACVRVHVCMHVFLSTDTLCAILSACVCFCVCVRMSGRALLSKCGLVCVFTHSDLT